MEDLLWDEGDRGGGGATRSEIYRIKGIVGVTSSDRPHLVQAVRDLYDITEAPYGPSVDPALNQSRVVLIGRILDPLALHAGFKQCQDGSHL
jgi:G3E family GTPase